MKKNEVDVLQINAGYKKGDAVTVLLDNMTEIVGRYVNDDEKTIVLSCVRMIVPQPNAQGGVGIALHPLSYSAEDAYSCDITFEKAKIVTYMKSMESVDKQLRSEDSGIVSPS